MGIPPGLALLIGLVGSARGFELSEPLAGLACDSETDDETLELGHRQLDVTVTNWLEAGTDLCAEECEQIAGCTTFHVMQSNGCIDEVGPDVCVPWAECTFFSRCEAMQHVQEDWMDCSSTAYFLTDRTSAPAVPSTADRRNLEDMDVDMAEMGLMQAGLSMPIDKDGSHMTSMGNVFQGNSLPPIITSGPEPVITVAPTVAEEISPSPPAPSPAPEMPGTTVQILPAKEFTITVTAAGTVETFDKGGFETGMRTLLACEAPLCEVDVKVTAASVIVEATVTDATDGGAGAVAMAETLRATPLDQLSAALGVTVESAPTVTAPKDVMASVAIVAASPSPPVASPVAASPVAASPVAASPVAAPPSKKGKVDGRFVSSRASDQTAEVALGSGLGVGLGFPAVVAALFFLHVFFNFEEGKRYKYLKWRFSHTNAKINCGYMPKKSREALWAEIKAPAAGRETGVEIPVAAPEKEKTDTI